MPQILRTTLIADEAQAADGSPSFDLPVNPLSMILLTVKVLNETSTITNYRWISAILAAITNLNVSYRGANIINGSLTDLAVLMARITGRGPYQLNAVDVDNDVRAVTVPICFGRKPYWPEECFPATRRGDLILTVTTDIAAAGYDNMVLQAETVELLDATPSRFTKITTTNKVNNAVSEHDIELPIGNDLLAVLLRDASPPQATDYNAQFGKVALQVDNVETMFSVANWETMHGELLADMAGFMALRPHVHAVNAAGAGQEFTREQTEGNQGSSLLDHYAYLDLDPLQDGQYALKTAGAARVNLRVTTEVASATAMRALPVELVQIGGPATPA